MTTAPDRTWPDNAWLTYKVATSCWGRQVFPNTAQYILATPEALAKSPEVQALVKAAEANATLRAIQVCREVANQREWADGAEALEIAEAMIAYAGIAAIRATPKGEAP